jgi:dTDP-4-amino-4,6-dideoxy-D-glucose transaminase
MTLEIVRPRFPELTSFDARFGTALRRGQVTNGGEYVREFEQKLTEYLGVPALAFLNGQTALIAMLMAAGIGPGDEVIMPAFTFCGTAAAVAMLGAVPVFAEIDPKTLTLDSRFVYKHITQRTAAILAVDVYGLCCDYEALTRVADIHSGLMKRKMWLLFDSAPAFGSMVDGQPIGRYGDAQIFSFHATKPFCVGEGGCLSTNSADMYERAKHIRDFGQTEDRECVAVGLNGKMQEVNALIGLENLKDWREYRHRRTMKAATLRFRINEVGGIRVIHEPMEPAQWPIWCYFPILIEPEFGKSRDEVLAYLKSKNIDARTYYSPGCHRMKPYANGQSLPVTEMVADRVIALPLYFDMLDEEMDYIADTLRGAKK